ncbi:hypothetical protein J7384_19160 [Endozoicomonas sp. G2_1]|uniref:hypothetical protein n=1 Tax=Endozoicomonas sp. G2_1 TaxID=2821091 RepID=UPI001ADD4EFF|nr:hypothetical protein [Endozoicomonas sp. G2_1]MBO9492474.1 hypothetical protein [Endozoicomonas sp. G2_1]
MNRILTIVGLILTLIYVVGILLILDGRLNQLFTMPLNEVGDFFAGIFGPVAFLWLILGFLQQGKELQQSTKALELQATELNNSVEQQRELVEVTRSQVEAEREALNIERERQSKAAKPNFIFHGVGGSHSAGKSKFFTTIKNTGSTSTHVAITSNVVMDSLHPSEVPAWETNRDIRLEFKFEDGGAPEEAIFKLNYTDAFGNVGCSEYKVVKKQDDGRHPSFNIVPIYS